MILQKLDILWCSEWHHLFPINTSNFCKQYLTIYIRLSTVSPKKKVDKILAPTQKVVNLGKKIENFKIYKKTRFRYIFEAFVSSQYYECSFCYIHALERTLTFVAQSSFPCLDTFINFQYSQMRCLSLIGLGRISGIFIIRPDIRQLIFYI